MTTLANGETAELERAGCTKPPTGWRCSREEGHEGPCAAVPFDQQRRAILEEVQMLLDGRFSATELEAMIGSDMDRAAMMYPGRWGSELPRLAAFARFIAQPWAR